MKNKKLHELSKKITENKLLGVDGNSIRTITGGKVSLELLTPMNAGGTEALPAIVQRTNAGIL